jgi:hypothetical protein
MIASNYGYTFGQIRKMTLRDVAISVEQIQEHSINEKKFVAGLHDKKIEFPALKYSEDKKEISESLKKAIEDDKKKFFRGDK